jgi:hypothetical protein
MCAGEIRKRPRPLELSELTGAGGTSYTRPRFKVARRAKYSDEFLDKATPFLKTQRGTARYFAEGKGSEDAKTFKLAEQIGERIDRTLASVPARKG